MFKALYDFIKSEYSKSSTKNLTRIVDEWESIFAKDVNLILLKCFMKFLQAEGEFYIWFCAYIYVLANIITI